MILQKVEEPVIKAEEMKEPKPAEAEPDKKKSDEKEKVKAETKEIQVSKFNLFMEFHKFERKIYPSKWMSFAISEQMMLIKCMVHHSVFLLPDSSAEHKVQRECGAAVDGRTRQCGCSDHRPKCQSPLRLNSSPPLHNLSPIFIHSTCQISTINWIVNSLRLILKQFR